MSSPNDDYVIVNGQRLPKTWPTCVNCAKTQGVDCDKKKDVGIGTCNTFKLKILDNKTTGDKVNV